MMVVLGNSYKGKIYTLIAHGIPVKWPTTLEDLLGENEYMRVSTDTYYLRSGNESVRTLSVFYDILDNIQPVKEGPILYKDSVFRQLRKSLIHMDSDDIQALQMFVSKSYISKAGNFEFLVKDKGVCKLALIDFRWVINDLRLMSLCGRWIVSSGPKIIEGIVRPALWSTYRNFFTDNFVAGQAQLEQMGYRKIVSENFHKMHSCRSVFSNFYLQLKKRRLSKQQTEAILERLQKHYKKCDIVMKTGISFNLLEMDNRPLSWKQIKGIFLLFFGVVTVPTFTLLLEKFSLIIMPEGLVWVDLLKSLPWRVFFHRAVLSIWTIFSKTSFMAKRIFAQLGSSTFTLLIKYYCNGMVRHQK